MLEELRNQVLGELKYLTYYHGFCILIFFSILIILFLRLAFPQLSGYLLLNMGYRLDSYFSIVAMTMITAIPVITGTLYAIKYQSDKDTQILPVNVITKSFLKKLLSIRLVSTTILGYILLLISIYIIIPVPGEGWLRSIFVAFLLAVQSPLLFLIACNFSGHAIKKMTFALISCVLLATMPAGLLLHNPWNYFAFFSPLYWIGWAWIVPSALESLVYGAISVIITLACILIFFKHFLKRDTN